MRYRNLVIRVYPFCSDRAIITILIFHFSYSIVKHKQRKAGYQISVMYVLYALQTHMFLMRSKCTRTSYGDFPNKIQMGNDTSVLHVYYRLFTFLLLMSHLLTWHLCYVHLFNNIITGYE